MEIQVMTNAQYLKRMRLKAGAEFMEQSVGLKMLWREMIKVALQNARLADRPKWR